MNEMQISFKWHMLRAVGQKSDRLSAGEWPNNEMRRGAVFGNRSFSPADVAAGIEFDKLTSGDLGLQHFLAVAKNGLSPQLNVYLLALSQNKAARTQNYFFVYPREGQTCWHPPAINVRADGRKMERISPGKRGKEKSERVKYIVLFSPLRKHQRQILYILSTRESASAFSLHLRLSH